uniref:Putative DNA polymerase n=1 Tax=viral metagenome TaxID=1070528 RepID=A0A6M3XSB0_9ZZZZ
MPRKPSSKKESTPTSTEGTQPSQLLAALASLRPGLANNGMVEQGSCFLFSPGMLAANNDFISITIPFEHGLEQIMAVQGEELYKLVGKLSCPTIKLEANKDGAELLLIGDRVCAGLSSLADIQEPEIPEIKKWSKLPEGFIAACSLALFSVSSDMTKPYLTCLWVAGDTVGSSDNYRITMVNMAEEVPSPFLLPGKAAEALVKHNPTHYHLDKNWLHFKDNASGMLFSVRRVEAEIPDVSDFLEVGGEQIELPAELAEAIDRSKLMTEGDHVIDLRVSLSLGDGQLVCRGEKDLGWIEETMECEYEGDPINLVMNPMFLAQILERTSLITIGENSCLFEEDGFTHVVALS